MAGLCSQSMYHALGYNTIVFIKALMTCDKKDLERSMDACKSATNVIYAFRQKSSLSETLFFKSKTWTDEELHAELCYAEILLIRAVLTFFHDDNFASFIKGALNIRTCYRLYRSCEKMMNDEELWIGRDKQVRDQFEAGVRMGLGTFNLMISTLPSKVLRLLEVVGFTGDKETGMRELIHCSSMTGTLHSPLCTLLLLTWHLVVCFVFGAGKPDIALCHRLLPSMINKYPKGSLILFLRARLLLVSSDINSAIYFFNQSIQCQYVYKQFHHGCYWELLFAHSYLGEWSIAANYAKLLVNESRWSRCVYTYMLAIFFAADESTDPQKRDETVALLSKKVDGLRYRIAGKSIPIEKYCARKANRYVNTKSFLFAHYEFIYFWNGFDILNSNKPLLVNFYNDIESTWSKQSSTADADDRCLYFFLRGITLRHLQKYFDAEQSFNEILKASQQNLIKDLTYLLPNSIYELALIRISEGNREEAEELLAKARQIKGYSLENKLHFRIHSAMENLGARTPIM
ncbi:unnamed protein product [Auanema sp. JU1783]|nr:unnamed protein product [Auanema sp. JU1783]